MAKMFNRIIHRLVERKVEKSNHKLMPSKLPELQKDFEALLEKEGEPEKTWMRETVTDGPPGVSTS